MTVAGTTNLGYVTGKGVSRVESNILVLDYIGRGDRISEKLGGKFWMRVSLACLSPMIMNSVFSGLSFRFTPTIHF